MKQFFILVFVFLTLVINAQQLKAFFNQSVFWSPTDGEYAELYLTFVGKTTRYVINSNGKFNSELSVLVTYSQKNEIKQFIKYSLKSPEVKDTSFFIPNYVDVQRILLKSGSYKLDLSIVDVNDTLNKLTYTGQVEVPKYKAVSFSNIELLESVEKARKSNKFYKNGYSLVPYVSDYYPSEISSFNFYTELYNNDTSLKYDNDILLKYYIEPFENSKYKLGRYTKTLRRKATQINVVIGNFNITKLPSGNYYLVLECISRENKVLASKKMFFQRNNKAFDKQLGDVDSVKIEDTFIDNVTNIDTLNDYIKCLFPIMQSKQITHAINQLKTKNTVWMQKFFYSFWVEFSPYNVEGEWLKYKAQVDMVNKHFSTQIKRGYETDRGRIYLKYGAPNNIVKRDQPVDSYPYEMWHYHTTTRQGNVKLVFYNPNMISGDFELLYTNLYEESSDPNWKNILMSINNSGNNFGNTIEDDFRAL